MHQIFQGTGRPTKRSILHRSQNPSQTTSSPQSCRAENPTGRDGGIRYEPARRRLPPGPRRRRRSPFDLSSLGSTLTSVTVLGSGLTGSAAFPVCVCRCGADGAGRHGDGPGHAADEALPPQQRVERPPLQGRVPGQRVQPLRLRPAERGHRRHGEVLLLPQGLQGLVLQSQGVGEPPSWPPQAEEPECCL